eukprot:48739-Eustigmatos_ZCMA.PRE.1
MGRTVRAWADRVWCYSVMLAPTTCGEKAAVFPKLLSSYDANISRPLNFNDLYDEELTRQGLSQFVTVINQAEASAWIAQ